MADKQPGWVSDLLWETWDWFKERGCAGEEVPPDCAYPRDATRHTLMSPRCAKAWQAIDRQLSKIPEQGEPCVVDGEPSITLPRVTAITSLLEAIQAAFEEVPDLTPHDERRVRGKRIANTSRRWADALRMAPHVEVLPWQFYGSPPRLPPEVESEVVACIGRHLSRWLSSRVDANDVMLRYNMRDTVLPFLMDLAASTQRGGESYSFTRAPVDGKAHIPLRLHFVRVLSQRMREIFGTPMHEQVADFANCLYPTTLDKELDAGTVAKLTT